MGVDGPVDLHSSKWNDSYSLEDCDFASVRQVQLIPSSFGLLGVVEASNQVGFAVQRIYFIKDVPLGVARGGHAHKLLRQCFICLSGSATIELTKLGRTVSVALDNPGTALTIEPGCWRNILDMRPGSVLLVLASDEYDEGDYIRDPEEFRAWEQARQAVVPYIDLSRYEAAVPISSVAVTAIRSGQLIGGPAVASFERSFAQYCGVDHFVGVGNGLDALTLALEALGVGGGDEVILPAHTFVASALAVEAVGARPVLVDVEADTGLMDVALVAAAITERTRAVMPVHLYGLPVDMDGLHAVLGGRPIAILEDAAQAHGARYRGRLCGTLGDAAAFSFYPTKNLGAVGDGGGLATNDQALAERVRTRGNYGSKRKYFHEVTGVNSRLDPLQAMVLSAKLPHLDEWNERRRRHAGRYFLGLSGLPGIALPVVRPWAEPVWHVFAIRVPGRRNELAAFLEQHGIGTNIHYPLPIHRQPCFAGRYPNTFMNADAWADHGLSLPLDAMHSDDEIDRVIRCVAAFLTQSTVA